MYSNLLEKQNKKLNVIETLKQNKNIFVILDLYHIRGPQAPGRGGFSELGPQANIGMGPCTFAHIYQDQPWGSFLVMMLAAAQWCPIVVSNVSTFFMYMF